MAEFQGDASFDDVLFARPEFGPIAASGGVVFDRVTFVEPVQIELAARRLSCRRTRFKAGGHLRVAMAEISLEDAEIGAPLILSAHPPAQELTAQVGWLADPHMEDPDRRLPPPMPSLVNVQRADIANLTVTDIDLADCRFAGAHHLDQLTITTSDAFHRAPARFGPGRQVLAEEAQWRAAQGSRRALRWHRLVAEEFRSPLIEGARQPSPGELAGIYRRLRKGREDAKNEPGAASFYYGECEMRRHDRAATPRAERWLLWLYWATSGYALRAGRALACLALTILLSTALLTLYGLPDQPQPQPVGAVSHASPMARSAIDDRATLARAGTAMWIAINAAVFRSSDAQLTPAGHSLELVDRVLGPVLVGLVLLSIRNRVKR